MTCSVKNYRRFVAGQVGAEDALGFGIKVVGAVAQVIGEAQDGAIVGDKDVAAGAINGDALAAQVAQGGGIIDLTDGERAVGTHH